MMKYIANIAMIVVSCLYIHHGAKTYVSASESSVTQQTYQEQRLNEDNLDKVIGIGRCGVGGIFLAIGVGTALQRRRDELEERLEDNSTENTSNQLAEVVSGNNYDPSNN